MSPIIKLTPVVPNRASALAVGSLVSAAKSGFRLWSMVTAAKVGATWVKSNPLSNANEVRKVSILFMKSGLVDLKVGDAEYYGVGDGHNGGSNNGVDHYFFAFFDVFFAVICEYEKVSSVKERNEN